MATPKQTLWAIEPHTQAKHKILEHYLKAWFPILSRYHGRIIYLDGFCGPGRYTGGEVGSPLVAIEVAKNHLHKFTGELVFIFIDERKDRIDNLDSELEKLSLPDNFNIYLEVGEFDKVIDNVLNKLEKEKSTLAPTFAFIDPFGFSGIPFSVVKKLLTNSKVEVLITFMNARINQFITDENNPHIVEVFGSKDIIEIIKKSTNRISEIRNFYQKQLSEVSKFVRYFEMRDSNNRPIYDLFFASNHPLGHVKMKEAMWKVDDEGYYSFSDNTDPNQPLLFKRETSKVLFDIINKNKKRNECKCSDIKKYVEDYTGFLEKHMKGALKYAEENKLITVEPIKSDGQKRRKGTFPDEVIIKFI